ncbi:MAG: hypothetical protein ACRCUY_12235 [Thermoguttaceae bacterium]
MLLPFGSPSGTLYFFDDCCRTHRRLTPTALANKPADKPANKPANLRWRLAKEHPPNKCRLETHRLDV